MTLRTVAFTRLLPLLLPVLSLVGCAHQTYANTIKPLGDASNIAKYAILSRQANDLPEGAGAEVRVLLDKLPEGMSVKDGELDYDKHRYSILGEIRVAEEPNSIGMWFENYDSHELWKNVYCNIQVPLNWVSIYTWVALPFYWPCLKGGLKEDARLEHMVAKLQNAAVILGGNLVVASPGATSFVNTQTRQVLSTANATHLIGIVMRDLQRPIP